MAQLSFWNFTY